MCLRKLISALPVFFPIVDQPLKLREHALAAGNCLDARWSASGLSCDNGPEDSSKRRHQHRPLPLENFLHIRGCYTIRG